MPTCCWPRNVTKGIAGEPFNFGLQSRVTVLDMTLAVLAKWGEQMTHHPNEAKERLKIRSLDSTKARQLLGSAPRYNLDDRLKETILWYREFLSQ